MAGELETTVVEFFGYLDTMNADGLLGALDDDVESVDEITRRWLRGREQVEGYLRQLIGGAVTDVTSKLNDIHERSFGDVGVVTGWLEQDYMLDGAPQHVSAPTTILLRRRGSDWKLALFHSIPVAEG